MYKSKDTGINGILNYLYKYNDDLIKELDRTTKDSNQFHSKLNKLLRLFLIKNNIKYKRNKEYISVQNNWNEFKLFLNDY
tara:strand:+ start:779 stop:1018 length:240 start_codon:yes stop_codon:yes gene_type:complete